MKQNMQKRLAAFAVLALLFVFAMPAMAAEGGTSQPQSTAPTSDVVPGGEKSPAASDGTPPLDPQTPASDEAAQTPAGESAAPGQQAEAVQETPAEQPPAAFGLADGTVMAADEAQLQQAIQEGSSPIVVTQNIALTQALQVPEGVSVTVAGQSGGITLSARDFRHFSMGATAGLALQNLVLDGGGTGGGIAMQGGSLALDGVTVQGCGNAGGTFVAAIDSYSQGGGNIAIGGSSRITSNHGFTKGVLAVKNGILSVSGSAVFSDNQNEDGSYYESAGIYAENTPLRVEGNALFTNSSPLENRHGGAIYATGNGDIYIGGNATFEKYGRSVGSGLSAKNLVGNITVEGNATFRNNGGRGIGMDVVNGDVLVGGSASFHDNGGGIRALEISGNLTVTGSVSLRNNHDLVGGGILMNMVTGDVNIVSAADGTIAIEGNSSGAGGGLFAASLMGNLTLDGSVSIKDNTLTEFEFSNGGGLMATGTNGDIRIGGNVQFVGNKSPYKSGGGAYLAYSQGNIYVSGNTLFSGNSAKTNGGGMAVVGLGKSLIISDDVQFKDNTLNGWGDGGGLYADSISGDLTIQDRVALLGNQSMWGGAAHLKNVTGALTIRDSVRVEGNTTQSAGSNFYIGGTTPPSSVQVYANSGHQMSFLNNTGLVMSIEIQGAGPDTVASLSGNILFQNNNTSLFGYGNFTLNIGTDGNSNIRFIDNNGVGLQAGGVSGCNAIVNVGPGTLFENNQAETDYPGGVDGGALSTLYGELHVQGTAARPVVFRNNLAPRGGAVNVVDGDKLTINHAVFLDNKALNDGGALSISDAPDRAAPAVIRNTLFRGNTAVERGGAIGISNNQGYSLDIIDTVLENNSVTGDANYWKTDGGGAIHLNLPIAGSELHITGSILRNNWAPRGGAIGFKPPTNVTAADCLSIIRVDGTTFSGNRAFDLYGMSDPGITALHQRNINPGMGAVTYSMGLDYAFNNFDIEYAEPGNEKPTPQFTIAFDGKGGQPVPAPMTVELGRDIEQPTIQPRLPGAQFLGWADADGRQWRFRDGETAGDWVRRDTVLYAMWDKDVYRVDFTSGGDIVETQFVGKGSPVSMPQATPAAPPHSLFSHWAAADGTRWDFDTPVEENLVITAVWQQRTYIVRYDTAGGLPVPHQATVQWDDGVVPAVQPEKTGYRFAGWEVSQGGTPGTLAAPGATYGQLAQDDTTPFITLRAVYQAMEYTVTFLPGAQDGSVTGLPAPGGAKAAFGSVYQLPESPPQRAGHTFEGWAAGWNSAVYPAGGTFTMPASDAVLTAQWKAAAASSAAPPASSAAPVAPSSSSVSSAAASSRPAASASSSAAASSRPAASQSSTAPGAPSGGGGGTDAQNPASSSGGVPRDPGAPQGQNPRPLPPLTGLQPHDEAKAQRQTGNPITDLLGGNVPLGGVGVTGSWSLLGLLLALVSLVYSIVLGVGMADKRRHHQPARPRGSAGAMVIFGAVACFAAPVLWLLNDNLHTPMTWVNRSTPLVGLALVLGVALTAASRLLAKRQQGTNTAPGGQG